MDLTLQLAAMVTVFGLSAWGWGRVLRFLGDRRLTRIHSLTLLLGVALLNGIGGLLNLCHVASRPALLGLLGLGVVLAFLELRRLRLQSALRLGWHRVPLLLALGLTLLTCHWLAPAGVYNIHDDFHTYVTRAVRIAQTGSLGGNPFDQLGLDSLGSQSFFHAFFLQGPDTRMLNGFDAVFCFGLCLALVAELALRWRLPWWIGAMTVLGAWFINPQYVNISPLYSGVAAILGLTVCGMFWARSIVRGAAGSHWPAAIAVGALAAWLITLKLTLAPFVAFYLAVLFALTWLRTSRRGAAFMAAARVAAVVGIVVFPWALAPLPALLSARDLGTLLQPEAVLAARSDPIAAHNTAALLRTERLYYGNSPIAFLALSLFGAAIAFMGLTQAWRSRGRSQTAALLSVIAAGAALLPAYLLNGHLFTQSNAIRYACPVLIGGVLIAALGFLRFGSPPGGPRRLVLSGALAACFAIVAVVFAPSVKYRMACASRYHTLLAYPINRGFANYSCAMTGPTEFNYARRLQEQMQEGATALVWTVAPFNLDFDRNRLLVACEPGLINPALRFPAGVSPDRLEDYLRAQGVRYVLMETNSYGVRHISELAALARSPDALDRQLGYYGAYFRRSLTTLSERHTLHYADNRMVLFELKERPGTPPNTAAVE